ncbi:MAG: hypothetical protein HYS33_08555 [Acidobacteria bacterium]|nr:hypothetical protein [Acidobacteriota bacterium]
MTDWSGFVRSENFALVAIAAEKFGCRPSNLVGLRDAVLALDFDLAAAARLLEMERAARLQGGSDVADSVPSRQATRTVDW